MPGQLKSPPLVEAILEIKWKLDKIATDSFEDPGFKLAYGRLYDRIKNKFPYLQKLSASMMPEELTPYAVRYQFRSEQNGWPLVQLGPGIATVNYTYPYTWKKFRSTVSFFIPLLLDSYLGVIPERSDYTLELDSVILRYINAIEWNWADDNTLDYLASNLHTRFELPDTITKADNIQGNPLNVNLQVGFPISDPAGQGILRIGNGSVGQSNGLIWEILFISANKNVPSLSDKNSYMEWLNGAHDVIEKWFFELIKGKLENQFKGGKS